ncbi:MAG: hypothetical protein IKW96_07715 [Ruminococcus sp.]|uniref:hypothetical protein n=1 Tax=Ruminococcus sp. TaxID=41978 RepID=UPI0025CC8D5C|nr:hypothetical protein [Ruminococcus sp.]MBR5683152.1 hypothetical protein [Ruminococcus sp.]
MGKFEELREKYPVFIYKAYYVNETRDTVEIGYEFSVPQLAEFRPSWSFRKPEGFKVKGDLCFERLAFSLGMAEAVSYWKATCSPEFRVECGELDDEQINWWKKLWFMGLGELFFVNGISADFDSFVKIVPTGHYDSSLREFYREREGCLVPIGGGKDSALTLETLLRAGKKCLCYSINKRRSITDTVLTAGLPEEALIISHRHFDRSLIALNEKGFINGHTPFSAIVAFSAEITAYLNGLKYIVLSNESSANESTVVGQDVNHQYSKSFEFEQDFHEYEEKYLRTGQYYFSFLRPLAEFQIAKMFVSHRKYLSVFRSCNLGSKVSPDIWCGECPKCLFISLILSPFLSLAELRKIFGKDMLSDPKMREYFIELIGQSEHKPFECVGSIDEVNLAVSLAIRRLEQEGEELPLLLADYKKRGLYHPEHIDMLNAECCGSFNEQNLLPDEFKTILTKEMERLL